MKDHKESRAGTVDNFITTYGIKAKSWVYPQLLAEVGKWTVTRDGDRISSQAFILSNLKGNLTNLGFYYFLMHNARALVKQTKGQEAFYCGLVPLILAAQKKYNGIKYSEWDDVVKLVNPSLYLAMTCNPPEYTADELLLARTEGLVKAGKAMNPASGYGIYKNRGNVVRPDGTELPGIGHLPMLAKMMLCQTWCAHPLNRNEYMILNPNDWDNMPEPLVDTEVIASESIDTSQGYDLPWD